MEKYWDSERCAVLVNYRQVIIDLFKHCTLTVTTDGNEDLLIHCLKVKPNQPLNSRPRLAKEITLRSYSRETESF